MSADRQSKMIWVKNKNLSKTPPEAPLQKCPNCGEMGRPRAELQNIVRGDYIHTEWVFILDCEFCVCDWCGEPAKSLDDSGEFLLCDNCLESNFGGRD